MRYSRQAKLVDQAAIARASVAVVGMGGLGCPAATYLAAAGVGRLILIDHDVVDESNLHRQPLYTAQDVGQPKVIVARDRLRALNPDVQIDVIQERFTSVQADVALDCTDNFSARDRVNRACVESKTPLVTANIMRFEGQLTTVHDSACYRCLYPQLPAAAENCAEAGVLGVLPGILGTLQATEALKLITREGEPLIGKLFVFDALSMTSKTLRYAKDPKCKACGPFRQLPEATA